MDEGKRRTALVGTGHRGAGTWGQILLADHGDRVRLVALCDTNPLRLAVARDAIGVDAPLYTDVATMLKEAAPDLVIVCSRDDTHADIVVAALEAGADVLVEKPMATTAEGCRQILDAERRTRRRVDVAFNYRFSPTARRIKELLLSGVIGEVVSVDFHWYLDTWHGADYFRRWHAFVARSGGLFVHKATHHFDLLNWYLGSDPREVFARGALVHYGRMGPYRGVRCRTCPHSAICDYRLDLGKDSWLDALYEEPSTADGYFRDACVFREEIDIHDTMSAAILYQNGVQVAYSLNTFMPIEGYHLAFNGHGGRIEIRQYEKQPFAVPPEDEILLIRNFGSAERIKVPLEPGGHFGGDPALQKMLFVPGTPDPLGQRAGSRAGAMSVLCGIAARTSAETGRPVEVSSLLDRTVTA
ncbi:MAG TPA: Gfo/Idh/MocA family oxidoreductase [Bauldia sp.]|nr:Gfo/Idh/MocA family oxidoreductase [Bauldia sp.]